jgi:hypothetical protein
MILLEQAADGWDIGRFQVLFVAWTWIWQNSVLSSRLVVEPVETHPRATQTVRRRVRGKAYRTY